MKELFEINAHAIREIGYDTKANEHFIEIDVMCSNTPKQHRIIINEPEYIALCGWIQIALTTDTHVSIQDFPTKQLILRTVSIRILDIRQDAKRMREVISDTYVQQERWQRYCVEELNKEKQFFWEPPYQRFGFEYKSSGSFIYYTLERVAACPQVDTGHLSEAAEKLVDIAQSPLFPRVDYELQLRWRNGQSGIDAGYATIARIDKNAILAMGRLLGGKK
jgi:hypothetical protein